jgi:hypothetical protein
MNVLRLTYLLNYSLIYLLTYLLIYLVTCLLAYLFTYLLHRANFFFEKLTGSYLVKKFPALYGTQRFIATFTGTRHLSLY